MTGSAVSAQSCSAKFTWNRPTGAVEYQAQASRVDSQGSTSSRAPPPHAPDNQKVFYGLSCSTEYEFTVKARGNGSTVHSNVIYTTDWSDSAQITGTTAPYEPPTAPAPSNVRVTTITDTTALVVWNEMTGVTSFQVTYTPAEPAGARAPPGSVHGPNAFKNISGLTPRTRYRFTVQAYGDGVTYAPEWGSPSDPVYATTEPITLTVPTLTVPTLAASPNNGNVLLSWSVVPGTGITYEVEQRWQDKRHTLPRITATPPYDDSSADLFTISTPTSSNNMVTATVGGWLEEGVTYEYVVRAKNGSTTSDWSDPASITLPQCTATAAPVPGSTVTVCDITNLQARLKTYGTRNLWDGEVELSWGSVSDGNPYYRVEQHATTTGTTKVWRVLPDADYTLLPRSLAGGEGATVGPTGGHVELRLQGAGLYRHNPLAVGRNQHSNA